MFKLISFSILLFLVFSIVGCPEPEPNPPKMDKDILSFSFIATNNAEIDRDVVAAIDGTKSTITATVPAGVALDQLVANFTTTGVGVFVGETEQTSGVTANNFSAPVVYTVRAENTSSRNYIVSVDRESSGVTDKAPGAPQGLSAEPRNASVLLQWQPPADTGIAGGKAATITGYKVFYSTSKPVTTASTEFTPDGGGAVTETTTTVTSLTNGTTYYFAVLAVNGAGDGALTAETSATPKGTLLDTPPGAPQGLSAEPRDASVLLQWQPPADTGIAGGKAATITGYKVFYSTSQPVTTASTEFTPDGGGAVTETTTTVTGLTNGTAYYFAVLAVNGAGVGALTAETSATPKENLDDSRPGKPIDVKATPTDTVGELKITWGSPPNTGVFNGKVATITEYTVYYSTEEISETSPSAKVDGTALETTITGLTGGTVYNILVEARNGHDSSFPSEAIQATPREADRVPGVPRSFAGKRNNQSVVLKWLPPADTGIAGGKTATITRYKVFYSTSQQVTTSSTEFTPDGGGAITETTATVTGLTNGTTYYFAVLAVNGAGVGALTAEVSATPMEIQPERAPGIPTGVSAVAAATPGTVTISWTAPVDAGIFDGVEAQLTGFRVYYSTGTVSGESLNVVVAATESSLRVEALLDGYEYQFAVAAINGYATGELSGVATDTTAEADRIPEAPTGVAAEASENIGEIVVTWSAPADTGVFGGSPGTITGYKVYYAEGKVSGSSTSVDVNEGLTKTITGLDSSSSSTYSFAVAAVNEAGRSWLSEAVTASPKQPDSSPAAPQSVQAVATANSGELKVAWEPPADTGIFNGTKATITGYTVYYDTQAPTTSSSSVATAADTQTATIGQLTVGTEYHFAVTATNGHGTGPLSTAATATSNVPADAETLTATENGKMEDWGGSILIKDIPQDNRALATAVQTAANAKYAGIIPSFVYQNWGNPHAYAFTLNTSSGKSVACLNGLLITVGETTYILDTSAVTPFRECGGGSTGGGDGEPKPGVYSVSHEDVTYKFDAASRVWDDELELYYYQAMRTDTNFDGLTTVEDSPKADRSGRYFMGYTGVWGQAFMSNIYRSNASSFIYSYSAVEGRDVLVKLHDDDIMKNTIIGGAPATYTHLAISFMKPNGTYERGSYDLSKTGLSYTYFQANSRDSRLGFIGLRESIRIAQRRNQKVVLAVGGASYHEWSDLAAEGNSGVPGVYINSLASIVIDLNADGLDVDYERSEQYGINPTEYTAELRGAIKAMAKAIDMAEAELNRDLILTIAGWSTGGDVSQNTVAAGLPRDAAKDFAGLYTEEDKEAARVAWEASKADGSSWEDQQQLKGKYDAITVGEVKVSVWGGGAGMHRHAFADTNIVNLLDIVSIMAYDASYQNYDPVEAYNQYRTFVPAKIPVLIGLQQPPEGWKVGQVLVTTMAEAGPKGTIFEADTYGNPLTDASYSVERSMKHVVAVAGNPHDGGMHWTMSARDYTDLNLDSEAVKVGATADSVALQVAKDLGLPEDVREHKAWTVWK